MDEVKTEGVGLDTKRDRLVVAGAIAPTVRKLERGRRRVTTTDKDGKPVRALDVVDFVKAALERAKIEMDVGEGVRPPSVFCEVPGCGARITVRTKGRIPRLCDTHKKAVCIECGAPTGRSCPRNKARGGRCARCSRGKNVCQVCSMAVSAATALYARRLGREPFCRGCYFQWRKQEGLLARAGRDESVRRMRAEGCTYQAISAAMGISPATVAVVLQRARRSEAA